MNVRIIFKKILQMVDIKGKTPSISSFTILLLQCDCL